MTRSPLADLSLTFLGYVMKTRVFESLVKLSWMVRGGAGPSALGSGGAGGGSWPGVLTGFFAGYEVADDDFAVAFLREEAVGEVVAVVGDGLAGDAAPGIEILVG